MSTVSRQNTMVINFVQVEFQSIFCLSTREFKILAIPNVLALTKSYEHGYVKKCDGYKLCTKSSFDRFFLHYLARKFKILSIPNVLALRRKFEILVIPNVLALRKSYEHSFTKKYDGYKHCAKSRAKSSFDRFFVHRLENSKYWTFPTY
ncbi:hypothetical protein B296_00017231 [Ensete ventricosum]|uniref:Uncharacterized protein n=1 Tax=Ensete ventricosum TaxID=4639 RepID=A0A426ZPZ5_ENSVE|nr:hypothetical protein B296_00017231 [Ensete ventricosum]